MPNGPNGAPDTLPRDFNFAQGQQTEPPDTLPGNFNFSQAPSQQPDSLSSEVQLGRRAAGVAAGAAKDIGFTGGADPFEDLLKTAGEQTGIPFLESADKVNQALATLQLAKRMHEAWQGLKQATAAKQTAGEQFGEEIKSRLNTTLRGYGMPEQEMPEAKPAEPKPTPKPAAQPAAEQTESEAQVEAEEKAELEAETKREQETKPMRIWDAFPGDTGLSRLADHVIAMEGDSKVARQNNNPGNLKDSKTGGFRKFGSYEEGRQALLSQLKNWRDKNPDWTVQDFNRRYAPDKSHGGDNPEGTEEGRNQYLIKAASSL